MSKLTKEELNAQESIHNELLAEYNALVEKKRIKEMLSAEPKKERVNLYTVNPDSKIEHKSYEDKVIEELREQKLPNISFEELRNNKLLQMAVSVIIADSKRR